MQVVKARTDSIISMEPQSAEEEALPQRELVLGWSETFFEVGFHWTKKLYEVVLLWTPRQKYEVFHFNSNPFQ